MQERYDIVASALVWLVIRDVMCTPIPNHSLPLRLCSSPRYPRYVKGILVLIMNLYSRSALLALTRTGPIGANIATQRSLSSNITTRSSKKPTKSSDSTTTNTTAAFFQVRPPPKKTSRPKKKRSMFALTTNYDKGYCGPASRRRQE